MGYARLEQKMVSVYKYMVQDVNFLLIINYMNLYEYLSKCIVARDGIRAYSHAPPSFVEGWP